MPKPKLKAFIAKLEDVDEEVRDFYVEDTDHEGKPRFKLDAEGLEDVGGLKVTNADLKEKNRKLSQRVAAIKDIPDEELDDIIEAGRAEVERQKSGKARDDIENVKAQMSRAAQKDKEKLEKENAALTETLNRVMIEGTAAVELAAVRGRSKVLMPHIKEVTKLERIEEDGKIRYEVRVLDPISKKERVDGSGNPIGIKALIAELASDDEFSGAFDGSGISGSGTPAEGESGMPTPSKNRQQGNVNRHKQEKARPSNWNI